MDRITHEGTAIEAAPSREPDHQVTAPAPPRRAGAPSPPQTTADQVVNEASKGPAWPRLQNLLTILPILTALLYVLGSSFREGSLQPYGLDSSLFPLTTDRVLYNGFLSTVSFAIEPIAYAFLSLLGLMSALLVALVLTSVPLVRRYQQSIQDRFVKWAIHLRPKHPPSRTLLRMFDKGEVVYGYAVGAVGLLLIVVVAGTASFRTGRSLAQQELIKWSQGKIAAAQVTTDAGEFKGMQITCSPNHCAFWTGSQAVIVRLDQIKKFEVTPATASAPMSKLSSN